MRLIFNLSFLFVLFVCSIFAGFSQSEERLPLVWDTFGKTDDVDRKFPRNYRKIDESIKNVPDDLSVEGLDMLPIAGSAQFTKPQLEEIVKHIEKKIIIIDLREETHLLFEDANENHITIAAYASQNLGNYNKSAEEIETDIQSYREYVSQQSAIKVYRTENSEPQIEETAPVFAVKNVYSDREVVEELGSRFDVTYFPLRVTDHKPPTPETVDTLIAFLDSIKDEPETVLFFHCQAGRGRTGVFMILTDMIKNGKKYQLSLDTILKRHEFLGSPDFSKIKPGRTESSFERYAFLEIFYEYVMAEDGLDSGASYSAWLTIRR